MSISLLMKVRLCVCYDLTFIVRVLLIGAVFLFFLCSSSCWNSDFGYQRHRTAETTKDGRGLSFSTRTPSCFILKKIVTRSLFPIGSATSMSALCDQLMSALSYDSLCRAVVKVLRESYPPRVKQGFVRQSIFHFYRFTFTLTRLLTMLTFLTTTKSLPDWSPQLGARHNQPRSPSNPESTRRPKCLAPPRGDRPCRTLFRTRLFPRRQTQEHPAHRICIC